MSLTVPDAGSIRAARNGDLVVFGVNGFVLASWMSRVPDAKQLLALTPGLLGVLLLGMSIGALTGLPVAGRVTHRLGAKATVRAAAVVATSGSVLAGLSTQAQWPMFVPMVGLFLLGFGSGVWDVAQNLEGTVVEQALGRSIMPWFHAAFSGGTVVAALIGAGLVWLGVPVGVHLTVAAAVPLIGAWWGSAQFLPANDEPEAAEAGAESTRSAWTEPRTLLIGLVVLAAAFAEGTGNDWMAVVFVEGHRVDKALGVVGLAVFLSFMTAGRILGTGLIDRYGRVLVLRVLFGAAILGCLMVTFGTPAVAFVGTAVWGLGASLGFPVGMSAAADDPARAHARISVTATIGYVAFLAGPPFLGLLGDNVGVLRAMLAVGAVSALAFLVLPSIKPLEPAAAPQERTG